MQKFRQMLTFNLIVAVSANSGIGLKGDLPWRLKSELKYFSKTTKRKHDASKQNAVIMGKRTYFGVPPSKRPLQERLNIVLSTTLQASDLPEGVLLFRSLEAAMQHLEQPEQRARIEKVWIVGGTSVYEEAMASPRCYRLYITRIKGNFDCDTYFPDIPTDFQEVEPDPETPLGIQEEDGVQYEYKILEKQSSS